MPSPERRHGKAYIWVTWLTKLLAGEDHCVWKAWFRAHFKADKRERELQNTNWTSDHAAMVRARVLELEQLGIAVSVENQNDFKWKGNSAIISGKPDIVHKDSIVVDADIIEDMKTGRKKDSDWWQGFIYFEAFRRLGKSIHEVILRYKSGAEPYVIRQGDLTTDRLGQLFLLVKQVSSESEPLKRPSRHECAFCDVTEQDCDKRWKMSPEEQAAEESAEDERF